MKTTNYTTGTLRKEIPEPKPHWLWTLVGNLLAMGLMAWLGVYLAERIMG